MSDQTPIVDVIRSIASGSSVDWDAVDGTPADQSMRDILRELRVIEQIAAVAGTANGSSNSDMAGDSPTPHTWGPLTVLEQVGRGCYGVVYRAWDSRLDREVALKLLRAEERSAAQTSTIEEGRLLARIRHPNVVTVHGADRIAGHTGIWMEFVDGRTLEQLVREGGPMSALSAARIVAAVARGLRAVHDAGFVHRDVKAQNVMRQDDGRIVLMDFGTGRPDSLHAPALAGTPLYVAPEVLAGEAASKTADVYSAGVLLYFLTTGQYPVVARNLEEVRTAHANQRARRMRDARPDLPRRFAAIVGRAIAHEPTDRYRTADALASALETFVASTDPEAARQRRVRLIAAAAGLLIAIGAGAMVGSLAWRRSAMPAVPFAARHWVLIVPFENKTADPVLDGSTEYAFERELSGSAFANVVSRDRVDDALRLMQKPLDTRLDVRLAREVCLRDGGIRAVLTGRIERFGGKYVLRSELINPATGALAVSFAGEVTTLDALPETIRQQALAVRGALGEERDSLRAASVQLAKVTTPSIRALQLYSQAAGLMVPARPFQNAPAERYLRDALREDPNFASAQILLAWTIANQAGRAPSEFLPVAEEALHLAGSTTEVERHFIEGSVHSLRAKAALRDDPPGVERELLEAVAAYEAVLRVDPNHYWSLNNARVAYAILHRIADQAAMFGRLADLRPNSYTATLAAADAYLRAGALRDADRYAARATSVDPAGAPNQPFWQAWLEVMPAQKAWIGGDMPQTVAALESIASRMTRVEEPEQSQLAGMTAAMNMTLGRFRRAKEIIDSIADPLAHDINAARWFLYGGDTAAAQRTLRRWITQLDTAVSFGPIWADAGLLAETSRIMDHHKAVGTGIDELVQEHLAFQERDYSRAIQLGERATRFTVGAFGRWEGLAAITLADAYFALGKLADGTAALERYTAQRSAALDYGYGGFIWIDARARLAGAYRRAGREAEARSVEDEVMSLLAVADPDYPQLRDLRQRIASRR